MPVWVLLGLAIAAAVLGLVLMAMDIQRRGGL
jgi:hypothetical protein